jgi:hypothetical protein
MNYHCLTSVDHLAIQDTFHEQKQISTWLGSGIFGCNQELFIVTIALFYLWDRQTGRE